MTKTEAIKAMLDEKVCVNNGFKLRFNCSVFQRKDLSGEWVADNLNLFRQAGWSIYTTPKKTEKRWLWLIQHPENMNTAISTLYGATAEKATKNCFAPWKPIKRLDGTNGTWDSGIEVEV